MSDIGEKDSVRLEEERVFQLENDGVTASGMRVIGLEKTYRKYPCGIKSKKDTYALRGVSFDLPDTELFCILGHNGAGKSTMIGVLTGIYGPSEGTAKLCGYDLNDEIDSIRNLIGVVP